MSTTPTEAHFDLWTRLRSLRDQQQDNNTSVDGYKRCDAEAMRLLRDSEARAVECWSGGLDMSLPDLYEAAKSERDKANAELARLRAEVERLKALSDNAASAMQWAKDEFAAMKVRAERAESELTLYRSKVFRMKSILSSIDDDGTEQHHSATAERAEAEVLAQAELLGRSAEREADLLGKLSRAEAALAAARKDSERLDWLWDNADDITAHDGRVMVWSSHEELRSAINAAMTNSKNT